MATHPKVLGLTLDPKLTYSTHIHNILVHAHKPIQIIKKHSLQQERGKQKETLMATYKAVMRPALKYASSIWSPLASSTSINILQVMQNPALRTATGCMTKHLHFPYTSTCSSTMQTENTKSITSNTQTHTTYFNTPRLKTRVKGVGRHNKCHINKNIFLRL